MYKLNVKMYQDEDEWTLISDEFIECKNAIFVSGWIYECEKSN